MESFGWVITLITGLCMNAECSLCNVHMTREYFNTREETEERIEDMLVSTSTMLNTSPMDFGVTKIDLDNGRKSVNIIALVDVPCYTEASKLSHEFAQMYDTFFEGAQQ